MTSETISSRRLFQAIQHGALQAQAQRKELNRINAFPVFDSDTGNNLAHTMYAILKNASWQESVRDTLRTIARSALVGARGNSGVIFSQYFNGLYNRSKEKGSLTLSELADCFHEAYTSAYRTLEKPVEGTVITLMRAWAVGFRESLEQRKTPAELFESTLARIHKALDETRDTLKVLRRLGFVDAGALGYYVFMEGFVQAILGRVKVSDELPAETLPELDDDTDIHAFDSDEDITFRYCTEVLLEHGALDGDALRAELNPIGDCLLLSSTENLSRVHIHTNEPWRVVRIAAKRGRILEQKADDMVHQHLLSTPLEETTALVTDSIADLPPEYVHQHSIFQLPVNIMIDGTSFLDKLTADSEFLYDHLDTASSAQVNNEQIERFLKPILRHYKNVLILTVSSEMSGTYERFRETLDALNVPESKAILVDTRTNSGAEGLLVRTASERIADGQSLEQVADGIRNLRERTKILVSVPHLGPMVRSGRISEHVGNLLIRLGFRPLITINREGKGTIQGVAFSVRKNHRLLLRTLRRRKIGTYAVVHADADEWLEELTREMTAMTGHEPAYVTAISSVITLFAGKGSTAVAYIEKETPA